MHPPSPLLGIPGNDVHFSFVERTDRRNLRTQLKNLVSLAQNIATKDLNVRREKLRKLIETEDKNFEEEFANSAKARLQSEIKKPSATTEKDAKKKADFLKKKRTQQYMNCCYEVREALRQKDNTETRICLEEQILENERRQAKQRELDRYWLKVQEVNIDRQDERQRQEHCVKEWRREQVCHVLGVQLQEKEAKLEEERKEKAAEVERINNLLKEMQLEELNRGESEAVQKALTYRKDLQDMMEAKRLAKQEEQKQLVAEHCELMRDIKQEQEEERKRLALAKLEHRRALQDYIDYVQRMRKLEADLEKMRNDRIDDLHRVDICTKNNIAEVIRRKAEEAQKCYCELRKQICEQLERRRLEEIERREDKIIENRFVHVEIPRSVILAQRRKVREDLDKQIANLKIIRAQEEEEYKNSLLRAVDDPETCAQLAEEYIREGMDYLDPHPNWLILLDPCKEYTPKGEGKIRTPAVNIEAMLRKPIKEPLLPVNTCLPYKTTGPCSNVNKDVCKKPSLPKKEICKVCCIVPCGCARRWKLPC